MSEERLSDGQTRESVSHECYSPRSKIKTGEKIFWYIYLFLKSSRQKWNSFPPKSAPGYFYGGRDVEAEVPVTMMTTDYGTDDDEFDGIIDGKPPTTLTALE